MSRLFGRRMRLTIHDSDLAPIDLTQLSCVFSIEKAPGDFPDLARITIYNLTETTSAAFGDLARITLEAGYEGQRLGGIFTGVVMNVTHERDGVDDITTIYAADGGAGWAFASCNVSLPAGSTLEQVAQTITVGLPELGVSVPGEFPELREITLKGPQSYSGLVRNELRDALNIRPAPYRFQIIDGTLEIHREGGFSKTTIGQGTIAISAATGMIGRPKVKPGRLEVKMLLNPALKPLGALTVNSAGPEIHLPTTSAALTPMRNMAPIPRTDGTEALRVLRVNHDGETRGQAWYTRAVATILDPPVA